MATHALLLTFDDEELCAACYEAEFRATEFPATLVMATATRTRPLPCDCPRCGLPADRPDAEQAAGRLATELRRMRQ